MVSMRRAACQAIAGCRLQESAVAGLAQGQEPGQPSSGCALGASIVCAAAMAEMDYGKIDAFVGGLAADRHRTVGGGRHAVGDRRSG
jgi:hypothetical protein